MEVGSVYPISVHGEVQQTSYTTGVLKVDNILNRGSEGDHLYLITGLDVGNGSATFYNHDEGKEILVSVRVVPTDSGEDITVPELWAANGDDVLQRVSEGYTANIVMSNEIAAVSSSDSSVLEASCDGREIRVEPLGLGTAELHITDVFGNKQTFTIAVDRVLN